MSVEVKPYTNKELSGLFNTGERTFRREIAKIKHHLGERNGHRWSVKQVEKIMEILGRPYQVIEEETY
ncbi:MAG: hypothetical protein KF900_09455 [Bacteroidetes bacterium]|nr:hypothetical protein [Bacteroidota bacterium]